MRDADTSYLIHSRDGRRLGVREYGNAHGRPIFFFHGLAASRLVRHPDERLAADLRARIIAIDRPGIGRSDPQPGRKLLDWPGDVLAVADALQIGKFAVLGWSAGGAHALACAYAIPERLTAVGVVGSAAPLDEDVEPLLATRGRRLLHLVRRWPWLSRQLLHEAGRWFALMPDRVLESTVARLGPADTFVLKDPRLRSMLVEGGLEACLQGGAGLFEEARVLAGPWGFDLRDVRVPVLLWHGGRDGLVPLPVGQHLARVLPDCHAAFFPFEGHFLLLSRWREIVGTLAQEAAAVGRHQSCRTRVRRMRVARPARSATPDARH